ncbi:Tetraspanin-2 [Zea mays]|uniref:Tetraspanin-2 n=1 Tax=Zea mays TaxID=4577 RepID=A0A1D6H6Y9_MAIZE|nr:Tetraspanin-2 [Zea mays]
MAVSNNITACVTLLALICAVPVIASGVWFASAQGEECARLARWPVAILGGLLLLAALAGFVGAYWNRRGLLAFYLFAMASLVVLLIALLAFAFAVTRGSGAYPVLGRAYDDYRLDGFSMWLRGYVSDDPGRWDKVRACLAVSDTCKKLARQAAFTSADQFYQSHLSPLQVLLIDDRQKCGKIYLYVTNCGAEFECLILGNLDKCDIKLYGNF